LRPAPFVVVSRVGEARLLDLRNESDLLVVGLDLSAVVVEEGDAGAFGAKSKAIPDGFDGFVADPKDAKAPDPNPNAVDPPEVGEASEPPFVDPFRVDDMLPNRRGVVIVLSLPFSRSDLGMEMDSLLEFVDRRFHTSLSLSILRQLPVLQRNGKC